MRHRGAMVEGPTCTKVVGQTHTRDFEGKGAVQFEAPQKIQMDRQAGVRSQGCEHQAKESESQSRS